MTEAYGDATGGFFLNRTEKNVELQEQFFNRKKGFYYKKREFVIEYSRKYGGKTIANSLIFKARMGTYHILQDFSYVSYRNADPTKHCSGKYLESWFGEKAETKEEAVLLAKKWVNRNIKEPSKELDRLCRFYFWLGDEEPKD